MTTKTILTLDERAHAVCQLIIDGKTTEEICLEVEHDYCDDVVFKSYITGVRYGKIRKDISAQYGIDAKQLSSIRANNTVEATIKQKITEMYNEKVSQALALRVLREQYPVESDEYLTDLIRRAYRSLNHQKSYTPRPNRERGGRRLF